MSLSAVPRSPHDLDSVQWNTVYNVWKSSLTTQYSIDDFKNMILTRADTIICLHEPVNHDIKGFFIERITKTEMNGKKIYLAQTGTVFLAADYQGAKALYKVAANHYLKKSLLHPFMPFYIVGTVFSWKGYLLTLGLYKEHYHPRFNAQIPVLEKQIIDGYGNRMGQNCYDSKAGLIKTESIRIKDGTDLIREKHLSNPNIKYFTQMNPDWRKGHRLCVVARVSWRTIARLIGTRTLLMFR